MRYAVLFIALCLLGMLIGYLISPPVSHSEDARVEYIRVTFYTLPGYMADGARVHKDAAACSDWMPFGTQLMLPDGYVVTCEDRGYGGRYWNGWIDVWAPSWQWGHDNVTRAYGDYAWATVVRWGWGE